MADDDDGAGGGDADSRGSSASWSRRTRVAALLVTNTGVLAGGPQQGHGLGRAGDGLVAQSDDAVEIEHPGHRCIVAPGAARSTRGRSGPARHGLYTMSRCPASSPSQASATTATEASLAEVTAPPYDVIDDRQRAELARRAAQRRAHRPARRRGRRGPLRRRVPAPRTSGRTRAILVTDDDPTFTVYRMTFTDEAGVGGAPPA